jgi:DNA invertase Pin-like site-specific DNA recombinase
MCKYYGYIRVSTNEQNTGRQENALKQYSDDNNIKFKCIFKDKKSGKDFNREQYQMLKENIKAGDILVIKELDRLGRNMEMIKEEWNDFVRIGVNVIILDNPELSTLNKSDLEKKLIGEIVFSLLSYLAEKERIKIQTRVKEGIENAKINGTKSGKAIGRPVTTLPTEFKKYYDRWTNKEITGVEFAKLLQVGRTTLYRYIDLYKKRAD